MTKASTPRSVTSPKASRAFPVRVPGPHIVLILLVVDDACEIVDEERECLFMVLMRVVRWHNKRGGGGVRVDGYYGMRTQVTSDTVSTG
jgi:hypothetical protein